MTAAHLQKSNIEIVRHKTREEWLEARSETIGASESAVLFGVGYAGATPLSLWTDKTFGSSEKKDIDPMILKIGHLVEPVMLELARDWVLTDGKKDDQLPYDYDEAVLTPNDYTVFIKDGFLSATPDGEIHLFNNKREIIARGVLEFKNVGIWNAAEWTGEGMPLKHQCQVQHQLMCTGYDFGLLCGLIGGSKFVVRFVKRHNEFIKALRQACEQFWEHVTDGTEPPAIASVVDSNVLQELHPDDNGETVELDDEHSHMVRVLLEAKEHRKGIESHILGIENKLRQFIGDATFAVNKEEGLKVSFKTQERKESVRTVAASKFRVLRVSKPKTK